MRMRRDLSVPPEALQKRRDTALALACCRHPAAGAAVVEAVAHIGSSSLVFFAPPPLVRAVSLSVLIPVRGAHDKLATCLRCLRLNTVKPPRSRVGFAFEEGDETGYEVIVACAEDEADAVGLLLQENGFASHDYCVVASPGAQGFPANVNMARSVATGEYLAILNSDCFVPYAWDSRLLFPLRDSTVVASGPVGQLLAPSGTLSGMLSLGGLPEMAAGLYDQQAQESAWQAARDLDPELVAPWDQADGAARSPSTMRYTSGDPSRGIRHVGMLLLVRATAFDRVGGVDEAYGLGNYDDDDLSMKLRCIGATALVPLVVTHEAGSSFRELHDSRETYAHTMEANKALFEERWAWVSTYLAPGRTTTISIMMGAS